MNRPTLALASFSALLVSCGGTSETKTVELLRAGDAKVCIAPDVEQLLRKLVISQDGAAKGYTIAFADATLETYDKVVSKASCHANIKIDGPFGEIVERTGFDFTIVPSAQDPDTFVVAAELGGFAERLEVSMINEAKGKAADQAAETDRNRLVATVKDGWLIGRWVGAQQGSDACLSGPFYEFARSHRYLDATGPAGSWKLSGTRLQIIGTGAAIELNIGEADQDSFLSDATGTTLASARRCSRAEFTPPPEDDGDADEPGDASGIDAENEPSTIQ
ncbi:hypothetical protein [Sphingomonas sp. PB4P5]|uniref:hypothetical protein n=1 Tax=Parasphingomonas puruogangriensis TaxID=3096155 RepID=UPI002FC6E517